MILKVGNRKIDFYNSVSVGLKYDTVASTFGFQFYFDPNNPEHRQVFRPASFAPVTIEHDGELLITGTLLSSQFVSHAQPELAAISGYSKTGVLEDCEIPTSAYPLQCNGLNLQQIAERVAKAFGITVVVDPAVSSKVGSAYKAATAGEHQKVKEFLSTLAGQKHVMISHDAQGRLLLTEARTSAASVFDFTGRMPGVKITHSFDGQQMHSGVTMIKQQTKGRKDGTHKKGNAGQAAYSNPYVSIFRPRVKRQTSGKDVDTELAARNMLSDELKGLTLKIELDRWTLGGSLVRPNTIVTVTDPDLYLFNKTRFFVAEVDFSGDQESETAVLTCYVPEVFGSGTPKNIYL